MPHNLDFRGRAYPVPPHLTHLSSDLGRSILTFAQGKPLGPKGLDWLKIHTINLTGMKKREPIHKRLEYANEILDQIIDSAKNPLTVSVTFSSYISFYDCLQSPPSCVLDCNRCVKYNTLIVTCSHKMPDACVAQGEMWWTKSDEPWQTLAACKEIESALRSPNAEEYVCSFPIHQDGSCNGLQHYAALGRDQVGAESVNLYPSSTPQDVYSVVAGMVRKTIRRGECGDVRSACYVMRSFVENREKNGGSCL